MMSEEEEGGGAEEEEEEESRMAFEAYALVGASQPLEPTAETFESWLERAADVIDVALVAADLEDEGDGFVSLKRTMGDCSREAKIKGDSEQLFVCVRRRGAHVSARQLPAVVDLKVLAKNAKAPEGFVVVERTAFGRSACLRGGSRLAIKRSVEVGEAAVQDVGLISPSNNQKVKRGYDLVGTMQEGQTVFSSPQLALVSRKGPPTGPLQCTWRAMLLDKYPCGFSSQDVLPMLAWPHGLQIQEAPRNAPPPVRYVPYALTADATAPTYVSSLVFYEPLDARERKHCLRVCAQLSCAVADDDGEVVVVEEQCGEDTVWYVPKCVCLLSRCAGLAEAAKRWLAALYTLALSSSDTPMEAIVAHFVNRVPAPSRGGLPMAVRVHASMPPVELRLQRAPPEAELPALGASTSVKCLLSCFAPNVAVAAWAAALAERRLLLISKRAALVTEVTEALRALLFPLRWEGVYVPRLAMPIIETLDFPGAILAGVDSGGGELGDRFAEAALAKAEESGGYVVLLLDSGTLIYPREDEPQNKQYYQEDKNDASYTDRIMSSLVGAGAAPMYALSTTAGMIGEQCILPEAMAQTVAKRWAAVAKAAGVSACDRDRESSEHFFDHAPPPSALRSQRRSKKNYSSGSYFKSAVNASLYERDPKEEDEQGMALAEDEAPLEWTRGCERAARDACLTCMASILSGYADHLLRPGVDYYSVSSQALFDEEAFKKSAGNAELAKLRGKLVQTQSWSRFLQRRLETSDADLLLFDECEAAFREAKEAHRASILRGDALLIDAVDAAHGMQKIQQTTPILTPHVTVKKQASDDYDGDADDDDADIEDTKQDDEPVGNNLRRSMTSSPLSSPKSPRTTDEHEDKKQLQSSASLPSLSEADKEKEKGPVEEHSGKWRDDRLLETSAAMAVGMVYSTDGLGRPRLEVPAPTWEAPFSSPTVSAKGQPKRSKKPRFSYFELGRGLRWPCPLDVKKMPQLRLRLLQKTSKPHHRRKSSKIRFEARQQSKVLARSQAELLLDMGLSVSGLRLGGGNKTPAAKVPAALATATRHALHAYGAWVLFLPALVRRGSREGTVPAAMLCALGVLERLMEAPCDPDEAIFRALLVSAGRAGPGCKSVVAELFTQLRGFGIRPNALTFGQYTRAIAERDCRSYSTDAHTYAACLSDRKKQDDNLPRSRDDTPSTLLSRLGEAEDDLGFGVIASLVRRGVARHRKAVRSASGLLTHSIVLVRLKRPMGIVFQENPGAGVYISELKGIALDEGSSLRIGDVLLSVDGHKCDSLDFLACIALVQSSTKPRIELNFSRKVSPDDEDEDDEEANLRDYGGSTGRKQEKPCSSETAPEGGGGSTGRKEEPCSSEGTSSPEGGGAPACPDDEDEGSSDGSAVLVDEQFDDDDDGLIVVRTASMDEEHGEPACSSIDDEDEEEEATTAASDEQDEHGGPTCSIDATAHAAAASSEEDDEDEEETAASDDATAEGPTAVASSSKDGGDEEATAVSDATTERPSAAFSEEEDGGDEDEEKEATTAASAEGPAAAAAAAAFSEEEEDGGDEEATAAPSDDDETLAAQAVVSSPKGKVTFFSDEGEESTPGREQEDALEQGGDGEEMSPTSSGILSDEPADMDDEEEVTSPSVARLQALSKREFFDEETANESNGDDLGRGSEAVAEEEDVRIIRRRRRSSGGSSRRSSNAETGSRRKSSGGETKPARRVSLAQNASSRFAQLSGAARRILPTRRPSAPEAAVKPASSSEEEGGKRRKKKQPEQSRGWRSVCVSASLAEVLAAPSTIEPKRRVAAIWSGNPSPHAPDTAPLDEEIMAAWPEELGLREARCLVTKKPYEPQLCYCVLELSSVDEEGELWVKMWRPQRTARGEALAEDIPTPTKPYCEEHPRALSSVSSEGDIRLVDSDEDTKAVRLSSLLEAASASPRQRRRRSRNNEDTEKRRSDFDDAQRALNRGLGKCAYLSPLQLRYDLELQLQRHGDEVLEASRLAHNAPALFWSLWWYCARLSLPLPCACDELSDNALPQLAAAAWDKRAALAAAAHALQKLVKKQDKVETVHDAARKALAPTAGAAKALEPVAAALLGTTLANNIRLRDASALYLHARHRHEADFLGDGMYRALLRLNDPRLPGSLPTIDKEQRPSSSPFDGAYADALEFLTQQQSSDDDEEDEEDEEPKVQELDKGPSDRALVFRSIFGHLF